MLYGNVSCDALGRCVCIMCTSGSAARSDFRVRCVTCCTGAVSWMDYGGRSSRQMNNMRAGRNCPSVRFTELLDQVRLESSSCLAEASSRRSIAGKTESVVVKETRGGATRFARDFAPLLFGFSPSDSWSGSKVLPKETASLQVCSCGAVSAVFLRLLLAPPGLRTC